MINTLTTLRAALDALDLGQAITEKSIHHPIILQGYKDLRALIASMEAQPEQAPFGIWHEADDPDESDFYLWEDSGDVSCEKCVKLYTHPAQPSEPKNEPAHDDLTIAYMSGFHDGKKANAEPLSNDQMWSLWNSHGIDEMNQQQAIAFARDAIAASAQPKAEPEQEPVAWMKRTYAGGDWDAYDFSANQYEDFQTPLYTAHRDRKPLTAEAAYSIGAKGATPTEAERLLFEAWMRGHCWAVDGDWNGSQYVHAQEKTGFVHGGAMNTRGLWAAWRDRAALAAPQGRKPLTEQKIYNWWSVDNGMEDCDMARLADFRQVVRAVEAALGIEGGAA